uniref:SGNH hydrolase-type esterase domain-containing protein n=1 Tax=Alexandrium catenella TaxID=2925 RepID=A0A7S1Q751_ALECA
MARRCVGALAALLLQPVRAEAAGAWPCQAAAPARPSPSDATQVHPAHISVAMAMGDSITAAFGARPAVTDAARGKLGHPMLPLEYRSLSFSGGEGAADEWTLPFFLRQYNGSLSGPSDRHMAVIQTPSMGYLDEGGDKLNAALTYAHSWEMEMEVEELIKQSKSIPGFGERWKLLTLLIGANDLCDGMPADDGGIFAACDGNATVRTAMADRYESSIRTALTKVRDSFGRIIVQLLPMLSISSVAKVREDHLWCRVLDIPKDVVNECACIDQEPSVRKTPGREQLDALDATVAEFNSRLQSLASEFNLQRPDFAVVAQSAARGQPAPDASFLGAIDCFHPSAKAQGQLAVNIWNGLFDRSSVPKPLNASSVPLCPGADAVIAVGNATAAREGPMEGMLLV